MTEPSNKKPKTKERKRAANGKFMPDKKRPRYSKPVPSSPKELIRSMYTGQLRKNSPLLKQINEIKDAVASNPDAVGKALLEHQLSCLALITEELFKHGMRSDKVIDNSGNLTASLTQRNYIAYQAATRQTITALKKLYGSNPSDDKKPKSPADFILDISTEDQE